MRSVLWLTTLLTATGCAGSATPDPNVDLRSVPAEKFIMKVGQTRAVGPVDIFFARVSEESRCPEDVACVWQGNAVIELRLSVGQGNGQEAVTLNTGVDPRAADWNGLRIRLIDLAPHPRSGVRIEPSAYQVELSVSGVDVS